MVALKGRDIARFVAAPDPKIDAILVYGPDRGLGSERARTILEHFASDPTDPFAVSILEEADLVAAPARLAEELEAMAFGGGRRTVFVRATGGSASDTIAAVIATQRAAVLIVVAGELRPQSSLRKSFEAASDAVALPCYADDQRTLDTLIKDTLRISDQTIADDARQALLARLGSDRVASRAEIEKLSLYAGAGASISAADVIAACADAASTTLDVVVDAMAEGRLSELEHGITTAGESGIAAPRIVSAAMRHMQALHRAAAALADGRSESVALGSFRPPIFFARRDSVGRQLRAWREPELRRALSILAIAARDARIGIVRDALAARALLRIAMLPRS